MKPSDEYVQKIDEIFERNKHILIKLISKNYTLEVNTI